MLSMMQMVVAVQRQAAMFPNVDVWKAIHAMSADDLHHIIAHAGAVTSAEAVKAVMKHVRTMCNA